MWIFAERNGNLVISAILFLAGLYWVLAAQSMPPGELSIPGPGFFPSLIGTFLCGISVALALYNLRQKGAVKEIRVGHAYIWFTLVGILLFSVFLERVGFLPMIILFIGFLLKLLSRLKPLSLIVLSIASGLFAYLFFGSLLGIRLPPVYWL